MVAGVLTLSEDDDVRLADLIDLDLVHVTGLFRRRRRDARQRRGADRLAQASQVPLGHQAHHQDLVLVAEVIVQVANFATRHNHLAPCHQSKINRFSCFTTPQFTVHYALGEIFQWP